MWTIVDLLVIQAGKGNLPWTVDHAGNVLLEGKERISMWVRSFPLTSHNRICRISLAGLWWGLLLPLGAGLPPNHTGKHVGSCRYHYGFVPVDAHEA